MKQDGLELAARFSYITNRLRYSGPKDAYKDFYLLLSGKNADRKKVRETILESEDQYPYLKEIADKGGLDILDYRVAEAHWIGNELLEDFSRDDIKEIIHALTERGLPKEYAESLTLRIRWGMNPQHSFDALFVGTGRTTGAVPTNLITMNKCMINYATVHEITKRQLVVSTNPIVMIGKNLSFGNPEIQYIEHDVRLVPGLKKGDRIAIHWDYACMILNDTQVENLTKYTQKNIDAINESRSPW